MLPDSGYDGLDQVNINQINYTYTFDPVSYVGSSINYVSTEINFSSPPSSAISVSRETKEVISN